MGGYLVCRFGSRAWLRVRIGCSTMIRYLELTSEQIGAGLILRYRREACGDGAAGMGLG